VTRGGEKIATLGLARRCAPRPSYANLVTLRYGVTLRFKLCTFVGLRCGSPTQRLCAYPAANCVRSQNPDCLSPNKVV